ncbi:MAG TPA: hypothetical protein VLT91_12735 [Rhizomicrobium sp.]|nr:hypothetical protein [Rhizomicrobium sp.]
MKMRTIAVTTAGFLAVILGPAQAGPRDDVLAAMGKCAQVTDDKARLACYDGVAPRLRDALNAPPEKLDHPPTKEEQESWFGFNLGNWFGGATPPAAQTTPGQFGADKIPVPTPPSGAGSESAAAAAPQEIDSITATVTDYSFNPFGKFIVFLDNGQVWREIDSDPAHFSKGSTNTVTIERGMLGSYNLHINDGNHTYKVTRVK